MHSHATTIMVLWGWLQKGDNIEVSDLIIGLEEIFVAITTDTSIFGLLLLHELNFMVMFYRD